MMTDTLPSNNKDNTSPQKLLHLVYELKHTIHFIAVFLRILQWEEPHQVYSFVLLCLAFLYSTPNEFFLRVVPALILFLKICRYYYAPETKDQSRSYPVSSYELLIPDLSEIRDKVEWVTAITNWLLLKIDNIYRFYYMRYVSTISIRWRPKVCFVVSCLLMLINTGWLAFLLQFDLVLIFCCSVQLIMCLHSPWFNTFKTASVRVVSSIILRAIPSATSVTPATAMTISTTATNIAAETTVATAATVVSADITAVSAIADDITASDTAVDTTTADTASATAIAFDITAVTATVSGTSAVMATASGTTAVTPIAAITTTDIAADIAAALAANITAANTTAAGATATATTAMKHVKTASANDAQGHKHGSVRRFEIHQHQRWWPFYGWCDNLLPGERNVWYALFV